MFVGKTHNLQNKNVNNFNAKNLDFYDLIGNTSEVPLKYIYFDYCNY